MSKPSPGEQILLARHRAKLTKTQLAEKAGVSATTVSVIESGELGVTLRSITAIAEALDLEVWELLRP